MKDAVAGRACAMSPAGCRSIGCLQLVVVLVVVLCSDHNMHSRIHLEQDKGGSVCHVYVVNRRNSRRAGSAAETTDDDTCVQHVAC